MVARNLKPESILVESRKEIEKVKIIDFNLSAEIKPLAPLTEKCGSAQYTAPEVLEPNDGKRVYN